MTPIDCDDIQVVIRKTRRLLRHSRYWCKGTGSVHYVFGLFPRRTYCLRDAIYVAAGGLLPYLPHCYEPRAFTLLHGYLQLECEKRGFLSVAKFNDHPLTTFLQVHSLLWAASEFFIRQRKISDAASR